MITQPRFTLHSKGWIIYGRRAIEVIVVGVEVGDRLILDSSNPIAKHIRDAKSIERTTYRVAYLRQGETRHEVIDIDANNLFASKEELLKSL